MKKEIFLDVDGVLLDWCNPFIAKMHTDTDLKYDDIKDYAFTNFYEGNNLGIITDIAEFNKMPEYGELPALANPADIMKLKEAGWDLHIITQIEEPDMFVQDARLENLKRNFSDVFSSYTFTYRGEDKLQTLLEMRPTGPLMVVEDNPSFLKKANDYATTEMDRYGVTRLFTFGIKHPYNLKANHMKYLVMVDSMKQVRQVLTGMLGE